MSDVITELANEANDKTMEIARLKSENAKLREQVERLRTQLADMTKSVGRVEERCAKTFEVGKRWMAKAARFEAENTKLRELVKRMFDRVNYECRCCSVFCSDWDEDNECCVFTTLMRELGVDE